MLLRTQRICWARVESLVSMAVAQWTRSCSMQLALLKVVPRVLEEVGKEGHGRE